MKVSCPAKEIQVLKNFYKINFFLNFRSPKNRQCLDHPFLPRFSWIFLHICQKYDNLRGPQ
jgi:hypothetical protein